MLSSIALCRSTVRDKIIPHAVSWFTGEAIQDEEIDMDVEEDDEDIEEDEDEEEDEDGEGDDEDDEDEDDEDEGKTKKKVVFWVVKLPFYASIVLKNKISQLLTPFS